jgi:diguanylate cyclase
MIEKNSRHVNTNAQKAWRRVHELDLLPSPENYSVLFAYYEESDPELKLAVSEAMKLSGRDPVRLSEVFNAVYEKYLSSAKHENFLHGAAGKFDQEIAQMLAMVSEANDEAEQYSKVLNNFTKDINKSDVSVDQMRSMVERMQAETTSASSQNSKLREQLATSLKQVQELRVSLDSVRREALIDPLTGIGNRKAFTGEISKCIEEAIEKGEPLSVLMVDIDFFKKFNDKYGHLVGDEVLKLVASALKENIKGRDFVARWGGEEFGVLLPGTRLEDAVKVGDHLRRIVASKKIIRKPQNEDLGVITLSMGCTVFCKEETIEEFVDRADQGLYKSKKNGRNQVTAMPVKGMDAVPDAIPMTGVKRV